MADSNSTSSFYVYLHRRATDGRVFYVGKGTGQRAYWFHGRSVYWNRVKNKYGVIVEIYLNNLQEEESHLAEIKIIKEFGRENLCNLTDGGEGMSGWTASNETKALMSQLRKGRRHSEESKQKMSDARKGVKKSLSHIENQAKSMIGKEFTIEHKKRLSEAIKKRVFNPEWGEKSGKARMKKTLCINNGIIYESTKQAAKELGLQSCAVSMVATKKYKHTKGYVFQYIENNE